MPDCPRFFEGPATGHELGLVGIDLGQFQVRPEAGGKRLAVVALQDGLGVEAVHLAQAALHEEEDDALGLGRKVGFFGSERINGPVYAGEESALLFQKTAQGQRAEPEGGGLQKIAP